MSDFKDFLNSYLELNYIDYLEYNGVFRNGDLVNGGLANNTTLTTSTTSTIPTITFSFKPPSSTSKSASTSTTTNVSAKPMATHIKPVLKSRASKKDIPKVNEFVPFSRDYIHRFTKLDPTYKNSLFYAYSKPEIIDEIYKDEEYIKDQSEISKLHYLSETIAKYRQLFGFPQHELKFRNDLMNDIEVKRLKSNVVKSSAITKVYSQDSDHFSSLYYLRSGTTERGYLSILARYTQFKNNTLAKNISLHFPFTDIEKIILRNSNIKSTSPLKELYYVSKELPGRAPVDIIRYLKDEDICAQNENFKKLDVLLRNHEKEKTLFTKDINPNKDLKEEVENSKTIYSDKKKDVVDVNQLLLDGELGKAKNQTVVKSNEKKIVKHFVKDFSKFSVLSTGGGSVLDVKFDPTGYTNKIMALSKGKRNSTNSILYDYKKQTTQALVFHEKQCNEGHFSINGSKVITCSKDGRIASWSTDNAELLGYYEHEQRSPCLRINLHRSNELAVAGFKDKSMVIYNFGIDEYFDITAPQDLDLWPCAVTDLSFGYGKNSEYVAAGIGSITDEAVRGFVTVIDSNRPEEYLNLFVQERDVSSIAWHPRLHDCLAAASNDQEKSICIYDLRDIDPVAVTIKTNQEDVNICCYSPCGNYISISGTPNYTYVFDTRNCKKPFRELRHKINQNNTFSEPKLVNHAQWSRNGEFFGTAADDGVVRIWDIENDKQLIALEHAPFPGTPINYFDISINSDLIVSGGDDGNVVVYGLDH